MRYAQSVNPPASLYIVFLHYALFLGVLTTSSSMLQSNQFLAAHLEE